VSGAIVDSDVLCDRCTFNSASGSIELSGPLQPEGRYNLNSPTGDIRIAPTGTVSFDLEAMTRGTVTSDFPIKPAQAGPPPSPGARYTILRGIVGKGSTVLSLRSFTGNISIVRRPEAR
jgi:hypothetical protein